MKNFFLVLMMLFLSVSAASAAENLETWTSDPFQGDITFTLSGTTATVSASAGEEDYAWGQFYRSFPGSCGGSATFRIDSLSNASGADTSLGLRKYIGINSSGRVLLAEVYLNVWKGDYRVMYRIREREQDGTTVRDLARGWLGGTSGTFTPGEEVTIGLVKVGCDTVFYCSAIPGLTRVSNCDFQNYPVGYSDNLGVYTYTDTNSGITGTVSNVNVAHSVADAESLFGGTTIKSYNSGYQSGLSQAGSAPEKPVLLDLSGTTSQSGALYWNTVLNATWYKVWIGDATGTAVVKQWYDSNNIDTDAGYCFINSDVNLEPGDYDLYVKSYNENGSIWSDVMSFTVPE